LRKPSSSGTALATQAAFGAAFSLLLGVGVAAVLQTYAWEASVAWVTHTFEVINRLNEFAQETRDFGAARNSAGLAKLDWSASEIARLSSDNPTESSKSKALQNLVSRAKATDSNAGENSQILAIVADMRNEERRLLDIRMRRSHEIASFARTLFELACALSFLLTLLAAWRTRLANKHLQQDDKETSGREAHYRTVVENAGDLIFRTDKLGRFTFCNQTSLTTLLLTEQEVISRSYLKLIRVDRRRKVERFYMRQFSKRVLNTYCEFPVIDGHGRERWVGQNVQLLMENEEVTGFQGIAREITDRMRFENEMLRNHAFVERVAETTPGLLYVFDLEEQRNIYCNHEALTLLGREPKRFGDSAIDDLQGIFHPDDLPSIKTHHECLRFAHDREIRRIEYRVRHADGHWIWLASRDAPFERNAAGLVKRIVGIAQDISARKAAQEKLALQAKFDDLTGLINRQSFSAVLQRVLTRAEMAEYPVALCVFHIEDFRKISQRDGRKVSDAVLKRVGDFLRTELRSVDVTGRLGVDEFGFVLPETSGTDALEMARRLHCLLTTIRFAGAPGKPMFRIAAAFGVTESKPGMDARDLLEAADHVLYRARETKCGVLFLDLEHLPVPQSTLPAIAASA